MDHSAKHSRQSHRDLLADIQGQLQDHPAAYGLQVISHGFTLVTRDDYETVERATFLYDALYAIIMESQGS